MENTLFIYLHHLRCKLSDIWRFAASFLLHIFLFPLLSFSLPESDYDEISVHFKVQSMGGKEIPTLIRDETAYLSICDVFDFLEIKNNPSPGFSFVEGFFITEKAAYRIDKEKNSIQYQGKSFNLKSNDLIQTESGLYLKAEIFGEVFGLNCTFSFRSISVTLDTNHELPALRELRLQQMRSNINSLKGHIEVDSIIGRNYSFFDLGMANWSVRATQTGNGRSDTWLKLALGSMIAGGEANVSLNYIKGQKFNSRQQYYNWRYVNNNNQIVRQIKAGKLAAQAISSINTPVAGLQLTNTPTNRRQSFGTYTLSNFTEPGWTVELYVNNVIVDYVKADASGFFTFDVPLIYGNSNVKLRYYGPWGEERSSEQSISIPQNILPKNELEYSIGFGVLEDGKSSKFSRLNVNYGVSSRLSLGGGIEYLSTLNKMPFFNMAYRLSSDVFFTGEYTHGVRSMGMLRIRRPSNFQMELNYTKYMKGQKAINNNYLEDRKLTISMPLRMKNLSAFSRLTFNQLVFSNVKQTRAELLLSGGFLGVNANITTHAMYSNLTPLTVRSNFSMAFRTFGGFLVRPRIQYTYKENELISARCDVEKKIFKRAYLNLSYEHDFSTKNTTAELGLRFDLSFSRTAFSVRRSKNKNTFVQSAQGSLLYDSKTKYLGTHNRTSIGKGGITLLPFLDLNSNGKYENNEPKVSGLRLRAKAGRVVRNTRDTVIHLCELEPYNNFIVELDPNSFENIAWRLQKAVFSIAADPNRFKLVEVPISVVGEVAGMVYRQENGEKKGKSRMSVNFYNQYSELAGSTITEQDGYFSYLGLKPGSYTVRVDSVQLQKLGLMAVSDKLSIELKTTVNGEYVDGLEFVLKEQSKDTIDNRKKEDIDQDLDKLNSQNICFIQVGRYKNADVANFVHNQIGMNFGRTSLSVFDGEMFSIFITGSKDCKTAELLFSKLKQKGYSDAILFSGEELMRINNSEAAPKPMQNITSRGTFAIQFGAFRVKRYAQAAQTQLAYVFGETATIVFEEGYYKVRFVGFKGRKEVGLFLLELGEYWFSDLIIVPSSPELSF